MTHSLLLTVMGLYISVYHLIDLQLFIYEIKFVQLLNTMP